MTNTVTRSIVLLSLLCMLATGGFARAESSSVLQAIPCESLTADCGFTSALLQNNNLAIDSLHVFAAKPPYAVLVNGWEVAVNLGERPRSFDFGGERPFVNPATGVPDMATFNAWNVAKDGRAASILSGTQITNEGIPGRIFKDKGRTVLAYVAGDQPVAGKCRSQLASYPVPSRQRYLFDLSFQLGEDLPGRQWHLTPTGVSPAVLWEMKAPDMIPSLTMGVDTDPDEPGRLRLFFGRKGGKQSNVVKVGSPINVAPNQPMRLLMDVFLDERESLQGGQGYWRVWVNGTLVVDSFGPTLSALASAPHQWFLNLYLYNNAQPLPYSRSVFWRQARMLSVE